MANFKENLTYKSKNYEPDMNTTLNQDIESIIKGFEQNYNEIYERALVNLLVKVQDKFEIPELQENDKRQKLWKCLTEIIAENKHVNILADVFSLIRILSREKRSLNELVTDELLNLIKSHIGLNDNSFNYDPETLSKVIDAEKALCNIIFNSMVAAVNCSKNGILEGIVARVKLYPKLSIPDDIRYFDMKLLFLISALCPEIRPKLKTVMGGFTCLMETLELILKEATEFPDPDIPPVALTDKKVDVICEALKALFNITLRCDEDDDQDMKQCKRLVQILRNYLLSSALSIDKTWQLRNDVINLLTNMPNKCYEELLIPIDETKVIPKSLSYEGQNMIVIYEIMMFLQAKFNDETVVSKQHEVFSPVMTVLLKGATGNRAIRKYLKLHILPPLKDVHNRPEQGDSLRNHLCKMLTTPITQLRDLVSELLFVLCKKNVTRMIKYTGYGNAAGLFAQRGLLGGQRDEGEAEFSSDSGDSETEEYAEHKHGINPVTGCYEQPRPDPMANMTEEQKEYEAMKLVQLMDSLLKSGTIKPCRVGADGKPEPIEHVCQLQQGLKDQQIRNMDSDSD